MEHPQFGEEHLPKTYNYVILNGARLNVFLWRSLFSWLTTVALPWAAEAPRWLKWTKIWALEANQEDCLQILGWESAREELTTKAAGKQPPLWQGEKISLQQVTTRNQLSFWSGSCFSRQRWLREITQDFKTDWRFLSAATECFRRLVTRTWWAYLKVLICAIHAERVIIRHKHDQLVWRESLSEGIFFPTVFVFCKILWLCFLSVK